MDRERADLDVELKDGRRGRVIFVARETARLLVHFEDDSEEWVDMELARERASSDIPPREIGS